MSHDDYSDVHLLDVFAKVRRIAVVGASTKWNRPSAFVMKYLLSRGFTVYPVNPRAAGQTVFGQPVFATLDDVPGPFEMVDVFRNSEAAGEVTDDAIRLKDDKGIRVVWMQITVRNDEAAARAERAGLDVIMNRCPKIEYSRLQGELAWSGVNTKIISSRRRSMVRA